MRNRNGNNNNNKQQLTATVYSHDIDTVTATLRGVGDSIFASETGGSFGFHGAHVNESVQLPPNDFNYAQSNGSGIENVTSTDLQIQRLMLMSAQILHGTEQIGGTGADNRGDYNTESEYILYYYILSK